MKIRLAKKSDAQRIRKISLQFTVGRNSKKSGFVEYATPSEEELVKRVQGNPFFYVLEDNGMIVGFVSAFTDKALRMFNFSKDQLVQHVLKKPCHFVYADQLAIVEAYRGKGFGKRLLQRVMSQATRKGYNVLYGATLRKPWRNEISIRLLECLGWEFQEEVTVYGGLVFGVYARTL